MEVRIEVPSWVIDNWWIFVAIFSYLSGIPFARWANRRYNLHDREVAKPTDQMLTGLLWLASPAVMPFVSTFIALRLIGQMTTVGQRGKTPDSTPDSMDDRKHYA